MPDISATSATSPAPHLPSSDPNVPGPSATTRSIPLIDPSEFPVPGSFIAQLTAEIRAWRLSRGWTESDFEAEADDDFDDYDGEDVFDEDDTLEPYDPSEDELKLQTAITSFQHPESAKQTPTSPSFPTSPYSRHPQSAKQTPTFASSPDSDDLESAKQTPPAPRFPLLSRLWGPAVEQPLPAAYVEARTAAIAKIRAERAERALKKARKQRHSRALAPSVASHPNTFSHPVEPQRWIGTTHARRLLGIQSEKTIKAWARHGHMRSRLLPNGRLQLYLEDVLRLSQDPSFTPTLTLLHVP